MSLMQRGPKPARSGSSNRLALDPLNPNQVILNPKRERRRSSLISNWWSSGGNDPVSRTHKSDKFATVDECPNLSDIGHTRPKSHFMSEDKGWYTHHTLDAGFVVAPQFYKNESDYSKFPMRPREQQLLYAGNDMMPIPQGVRTFWAGEEESANTLKHSVFVRKFHVSPDELRTQMQARYWSKKSVPKPQDDWWRQVVRRMASSFAGGTVDKTEGVWLPKGEMYADENRIQGPAEALQIWDATMNPGLPRSGSLGGFATNGATYANEELRRAYEGA